MINDKVYRSRERKPTEFSPLEPQYFLNDKGVLEESPIMRNTQEIIDSAEYTKLDELYDRLLAVGREKIYYPEGSDVVIERERYESDLDRILELDSMRDRYAADNPEVQGMSHSQLRDYINNKLTEANKKIKEINENAENTSKQESQQEELSKNG